MKWLHLYLKVIVAIVLFSAFYGVLLPKAISAQDTALVVMGLLIAVLLPVVFVGLFRKELRKLKECAKS